MQELLNEDQRDCLQEIINISYGKATARIATILDAFATMRVPSVQLLSNDELVQLIKIACKNKRELFFSIQLFKGEFDGECIFMLDSDSADNLLNHLKDDEESDNIEDTVIEITNLVTSALITELASKLHTEVFIDEPHLERINSDSSHQFSFICKYDRIILINTEMAFEDEKIYGEAFILTHEKSFNWLRDALDRAIDELF